MRNDFRHVHAAHRHNTHHVEPLLCQRSRLQSVKITKILILILIERCPKPKIINYYEKDLIESDEVDSARLVDRVGRDAEDVLLLQAALREHDADCHRRGQRRRHHNCKHVERTTNY